MRSVNLRGGGGLNDGLLFYLYNCSCTSLESSPNTGLSGLQGHILREINVRPQAKEYVTGNIK